MNATFETQLNALKADIDFFSESIKEVAIEMVKEKFTQFPIFIASEHEVKIGEKTKQEDFKQNYKSYKTHCCVLWLTPTSAQFVYIPYKKGEKF